MHLRHFQLNPPSNYQRCNKRNINTEDKLLSRSWLLHGLSLCVNFTIASVQAW